MQGRASVWVILLAGSLAAGAVGAAETASYFRFARGEEVTATNGMRVRLGRPPDFVALTDHAEYLGLTPGLRRSDPELLSTEYGREWHDLLKSGYDGAFAAAMEAISTVQARWTAYEARRFQVKMPPEVPMKTQERAYTSPIWYTPGA